MPIQTVTIDTIAASLDYYLIAFDADGNERLETDGFMSQKLVEILSTQPITDVFFMSHGWLGDVPGAKRHYQSWIKAMVYSQADIQKIQELRKSQNQEFRPLLIGLHWPSRPWGNEDLNANAASFDTTGTQLNDSIEQYAQDVADTEAAREALRTIFTASIEYSIPPDNLPLEVRQAYEVLIKEASLDTDENDSESFNLEPDDIYESIIAQKESEEISFAIGDVSEYRRNVFLDLLGRLSYWKMKQRARQIGETSGFNLLTKLQKAAAPTARFHLVGHSFGCIVVSSIVAGKNNSRLIRPVNSLVLIQGALSLWSYCSNIPRRANLAGCFSSIINDCKVVGPVVTTRSIHDDAVGKLYPIASRPGNWFMGQDINFAISTESEFPEYGSIGTFGIQGLDEIISLKMHPCEKPYNFQSGKVYNLESSEFIRNLVNGKDEDAHNTIDKPEVAHAVWSAAFAS
ncbi:hypothetical protein ANSO36C_17240 [Nostoc cf. commune SO-36]|uniref:Uncharacterized protein n=1 Tax=Nostoc cf. commune SO-36 TaxID=449208 RepID=A0ABM7YZ10_NOSCO|nr:hypothetical protein [Nostoc commune]BDI15922.1 hypothetical protein ANSO36C_17240 [Nostoc cf. commune SO-36]